MEQKIYINKEDSIVSMSSNNKAKHYCKSGSTVVFQTSDCYNGNLKSEGDLFHLIDYSNINPATGPLYIENAEPGDVLRVDILEIKLDSQGAMSVSPGRGALKDFVEEERTKIIKIEDGYAVFNDILKFPINPMIGVIGTAPKEGEVLNGTPGEHGSNMDCNKIQEGTSLFLPVNVPGALLAMGDLHAVMGDGESATCGIEISGEVTVKVTVLKDAIMPTPFLKTNSEYITIAAGKTLDEASSHACFKMLDFLKATLPLDLQELIMLLSIAGNMEICQVVNPLKTARMTMPIDLFDKYNVRI